LARELFPDGKEVPFSREYGEMIATTKAWLDKEEQKMREALLRTVNLILWRWLGC